MRASKQKKQQGFIILMGMLALVLGAAVWFGTASSIRSESMDIKLQSQDVRDLYRIKDKMLTYALFQPEIFRTDTSSNLNAPEDIPGPGYFPCPDTNGDGDSNAPCGGGGAAVIVGMVPESISSRYFTFVHRPLEANRYWYAVDARFVTQNTDFTFNSVTKRFVPLNNTSPATASLTLDGTTDIVMVLIYAGDAVGSQNQSVINIANFLDLDNADGDVDFVSHYKNSLITSPVPVSGDFNDYVIPITRNEWNAAMLSRTSIDADSDNVPDLCTSIGSAITDYSWFNDCIYTGASAPPFTCTQNTTTTDENLFGQGWRTALSCP